MANGKSPFAAQAPLKELFNDEGPTNCNALLLGSLEVVEHACIRGAGIVGIWAAISLASTGVSVDLYDPGGFPSRQSASWSAAGLLALGPSETKKSVIQELGLQALEIWRRYNLINERGSYLLADDLDETALRYYTEVCRYELIAHQSGFDSFPRGSARRMLYIKDDCHLDPQATLIALCRIAARLGVRHVPKPELRHGSWDIDCTGIAAQGVLASLQGVPGALCIAHLEGVRLSRPLRRIANGFPNYAVPWEDGRVALGAVDGLRALDQIRSLDLHRLIRKLLATDVDIKSIELNFGIRPVFLDKMPKIICQEPRKIFVNGVYRDGFLLAPILGQIVAGILEGRNHFLIQRS